MSDADPAHPSNLWEIVARCLHERYGDAWGMSLSDNPGMAMFVRYGPRQGNMSCHFSPRREDGPGQASVRQYLGEEQMRILKAYFETDPKHEMHPSVVALHLISGEDPDFDPGPYHVQGSWAGMGMLCAIANIVSPSGPELFGRVGPWYVDSFEAIGKCLITATKWHREREQLKITELTQKAESGDTDAQVRLAQQHFHSDVGDKFAGVAWMERAALAGVVQAQYFMGVIYADDEDVGIDLGRAVEWWTKAAEQAHPVAAWRLCRHYSDQAADSEDSPEAELKMKWMKRAAELGQRDAMLALGMAHFYGDGLPVDDAIGLELIRKSAELGNVEAMEQLGSIYDYEDSEHASAVESFKWLLRAAESGSRRSTMKVAEAYENGRGVGQNFGEAAKWYKAAANPMSGSLDAHHGLGNLYFLGRGVPRDVGAALAHWQSAPSFGGRYLPSSHCKAYSVLARDGFLLVAEDGRGKDTKYRILDTGSRKGVTLEEIESKKPELAQHIRATYGEDVIGTLANDEILSGAGFVLDMRRGERGTLWIVKPGSEKPEPLLKAEVCIGGKPVRAHIDTGGRYCYQKGPLPPGLPSQVVRDFSVYTGPLVLFEAGLFEMEVTMGDETKVVGVGRLPPAVEGPTFEFLKSDVILGADLVRGSVLCWDRINGRCTLEAIQ